MNFYLETFSFFVVIHMYYRPNIKVPSITLFNQSILNWHELIKLSLQFFILTIYMFFQIFIIAVHGQKIICRMALVHH